MRTLRLLLPLALLALPACDEEEQVGAAQADTGPIEQADGALCPPPLGAAPARPTARPAKGPLDDVVRINQLQAKATHNSYHVQKFADSEPEWAYTHKPLDEQLESQGVRAFEIDLHWVPECQRHEVFHLPIIDDVSSCRRLDECLGLLRRWSDAHLGHHPLFVQIEPKNDGQEDAALRLETMEKEILSVFPRESLITPDEVKGSAPNLAAAIANNGWPTLAASRGRVLFYMLVNGPEGGLRDVYTHGYKDLDGRLMFISSGPNEPFAGVAVIDDPIARRADIDAAVKAGLIVRTFAEKNPTTTYAEEALASGAQVIATDYPAKVASTNWFFPNPGTPSRCNVVNAPNTCTSDAIESPARLATPR